MYVYMVDPNSQLVAGRDDIVTLVSIHNYIVYKCNIV